MSPRFERRPDQRAGSGARPAGRGARFQPRREEGRRPERRGEFRGVLRGEGRPEGRGDFRSDVRGGYRGEGRGETRGEGGREVRGEAGREGRGEAGRWEGGRQGRWERRAAGGGERPQAERRYDDRRPASGGEPRSGLRPTVGRPTVSRPGGDRPAGRRPFGSRPLRERERTEDRPGVRMGVRPASPAVVIETPRDLAPGEADRFGVEPSPDLVWGRHPALAALESGRPIHRIWCTPEMRFSPKFLQLLREAKASGVLVEEVSWARLGQISGGAVHQGIVLQTAAAETLDLQALIDGCRSLGEPPLLMAVDGLTDPHNLGAIVRSAEALGAHGLVLPQRRNAGLTGTVAKVAAGALESLPVARVVNLNRSLEALKQEGYRVIGLAGEGSVTLEEADLDGPLVVVTGSEAEGLSMLTRRSCDQLVRIPLRGATPSLNASVATALVVYEIARRSWMKGISGSQPAPRLSRPAIPNAPALAHSLAEPPASEFPEATEPLEATESPAPEPSAPESQGGAPEPPAPEPDFRGAGAPLIEPTAAAASVDQPAAVEQLQGPSPCSPGGQPDLVPATVTLAVVPGLDLDPVPATVAPGFDGDIQL
ncbi:MAG: 23S rRNA (guanosine(2251)-2'-O)-methyltransferase RlmB [Cyanobacteriota bacterium]